ncbi:MAG: hypothetical protein ACON5P_03350 [Candidatus Puniceispirillaceae bacterium]
MTQHNSWKTLRENAPLLSYSLLFQPPKDRECLADLLLLGLEFDFILAQASEPMLALIRLKWWEEQLEADDSGSSLPLLDRIYAHITAGRLEKQDILAVLGCWQDFAESAVPAHEKGQRCWAELLALSLSLYGPSNKALARQIGSALYNSRNGREAGPLPNAPAIYTEYGKGSEFLILLAYLAKRDGSQDMTSDHLILFKMLWQVLARPA